MPTLSYRISCRCEGEQFREGNEAFKEDSEVQPKLETSVNWWAEGFLHITVIISAGPQLELLANFFCKGSESNYFKHCSSDIVTAIHPRKASIDNTEMNELGRVPIKHYVWMLTFEFHIIFTWHEIWLPFCFFQLFKTAKTILHLWVIHNPIGLNLACGLTPVLDTGLFSLYALSPLIRISPWWTNVRKGTHFTKKETDLGVSCVTLGKFLNISMPQVSHLSHPILQRWYQIRWIQTHRKP